MSDDKNKTEVAWKQLSSYLKRNVTMLPEPYSSQDSNRLTLAYFVVGALELLGQIDQMPTKETIDWIYGMQIVPDSTDKEKNKSFCGWRGSQFLGAKFECSGCEVQSLHHDHAHVAMTYVALVMLLMLGDDLSRVNRSAITKSIAALQTPNGGFCCVADGSESDMRYVYCACCVSYILNDWSGINKEKLCSYILASQSYDYAIAQEPGAESHAGSTYCAVASLSLMGMLDKLPDKDKLIKWLSLRQIVGFQGRPNKLQDTCYSFWVGATLKLLGAYEQVVSYPNTRSFTMSCQHKVGGFAKWPDNHPDVLHTYFSICGLSFIGEPGIAAVHPGLGISQRAHDRIAEIHMKNTKL